MFFPTVHWQCHSYDCVTNILFSESCFSIFAEPRDCLSCVVHPSVLRFCCLFFRFLVSSLEQLRTMPRCWPVESQGDRLFSEFFPPLMFSDVVLYNVLPTIPRRRRNLWFCIYVARIAHVCCVRHCVRCWHYGGRWGRVPVLTQLTLSSVPFKNMLLKERKENAAL